MDCEPCLPQPAEALGVEGCEERTAAQRPCQRLTNGEQRLTRDGLRPWRSAAPIRFRSDAEATAGGASGATDGSPNSKTENTPTITTAAVVTTPAVDLIPGTEGMAATASPGVENYVNGVQHKHVGHVRHRFHLGSSHTLGDHDRRRAGRAPLPPPGRQGDPDRRHRAVTRAPWEGRRRRAAARVIAEGKRATIHVERMNPALGLYERLGFEVAEDKGVYLLLERQVNTAS
jgi:hypothetical protein